MAEEVKDALPTGIDGTNEASKGEIMAPAEQAAIPRHIWIGFLSIDAIACFLVALEGKATPTIFPAIAEHFNVSSSLVVWMFQAPQIAAVSVYFLIGESCQAWGRRNTFLASLAIFSFGCALAGAAPSFPLFLLGRVVQGLGETGVYSVPLIIAGDIVPLDQRAIVFVFGSSAYTFAALIGPPIAGALAQHHWRWFWWLCLPLCALCALGSFFFIKLKTPKTLFAERIKVFDWS